MNKLIEYYLLEQLVAVADNRTLSSAAQKLHISQPAISRSMQKIEDRIGVPLFNRSKSYIELNENGKVAVRYARRAIAANKEVIQQTQRFNRNAQILRIGACTAFIANHFITNLHKRFPDQKIRLTVADDLKLLDKLANNSLDLIILHNNLTRSGLLNKYYRDERLMLTLKKTSPLTQKNEILFTDLKGQNILGHQKAAFWLDIIKGNIPDLNLITQEKMETLEQLVFSSDLPVFNTSLVQHQYKVPPSKITLPIMDDTALVKYYFAFREEEKAQLQQFYEL